MFPQHQSTFKLFIVSSGANQASKWQFAKKNALAWEEVGGGDDKDLEATKQRKPFTTRQKLSRRKDRVAVENGQKRTETTHRKAMG